MSFNLAYPAAFVEGGEGEEVALVFPDVPEAITGGADRAEALALAEDCLSAALTFYLEKGLPPPRPGPAKRGQPVIAPNLRIALKALVADAMRRSGKRPADLARLLNTDHKSALRILDPNHGTRTETMARALGLLGKRVIVRTEDKAAANQAA